MAKMNEKTRVRIWMVAVLFIAIIIGTIDYPKYADQSIDWLNAKLKTDMPHVYNLPFHLGLDLQGGTHLVYEADVSNISETDQSSSVEGVRDVIERRVNALGVAEPVVQVNQARGKWRVIIELAGVKDVNEAIKMIGNTPLLEFKEQNTEPPRELTAEEKKDLETYNNDAEKKAKDLLSQAKSGADFSQLVADNSDDEYSRASSGDLGFVKSGDADYSQIYEAVAKLDPQKDEIIKDLITDDFGYEILKVLDVQQGEEQIKANHILICYQGAQGCETEISKEEALAKITELKDQATPENFVTLAKKNSTEPGASDGGGDLGWFGRGVMVASFEQTAFSLEKGTISDVVETDFGYHLIYKSDARSLPEYKLARLLVKTKIESDILPPTDQWKNTGLSGKQLKRSIVEFDPYTNEPQVGLEFNDEGKQLFAEITERNLGKPVAIFLDGEPISVPRVNSVIKEGKAVISGAFDVTEAKLLSQRLNAGALPVPINLVSQQTVGASLGANSLQKSLVAGLIGLLFVALFMIFFYRLPGVLSVISLIIYTVILLFLFKLVPITLTLAGIAGFILSLGMAVDANVLIFERMKEELRSGKPLGSAIDEGFKRAWPSIRDGNASTLITCFILAWFGSSMIKGFAITLGIGVIISMLSAIFISRMLLKLFSGQKWVEKPIFFQGIKNKKVN
jgi:protein-export membrane protein SecD